MAYLQKLSLISLGRELMEIVKNTVQSKKKRLTEEEKDKERSLLKQTETLIRLCSGKWEFEECYKYPCLSNFDATVQRSIDLASRAFKT